MCIDEFSYRRSLLRAIYLLVPIVMLISERNAYSQTLYRSPGFIFAGETVISSNNEREFIKIGEKLPVISLKKRLLSYKILSMAGEDCSICVRASSGDVSIEINYDNNGIIITDVYGFDKTSSDALGHQVGASLREAIGSDRAQCYGGGMYTMCASPVLNGLFYIVDDSEKCNLELNEINNFKGFIKIPECVKVGGFFISNREM